MKTRNKLILLLLLILALVLSYHLYKSSITKDKPLTDEEIYRRLKITFTTDEDIITLRQDNDEQNWSVWKLIQAYNGKVSISPEYIDLSDFNDYQISFAISTCNSDGKEIVKEYTKTIKVVRPTPIITLKEKEITLIINDDFVPEQYYSISYLDDWQLTVENNVDTSKMGKYYLTITVTDPITNETISEEMTIIVIEQQEDGCSLIWAIDKEATKEVGHYETIYVEEKGHYETILISPEEGHYETIHHDAITHEEYYGEYYYWYHFYHKEYYYDDQGQLQVKQVEDIVKSTYDIQDIYPELYFNDAFNNYWQIVQQEYGSSGYYSISDYKILGSSTVIDKDAWDEQVWVVDKEAVYQEKWIIDQKAYSYSIWVVDVAAQREIGHWQKNCD